MKTIKKIVKKLPFVGSYVAQVQQKTKEKEWKEKLAAQKEQFYCEEGRSKVFLEPKLQNREWEKKISVLIWNTQTEQERQKWELLKSHKLVLEVLFAEKGSFAEVMNRAAKEAKGENLLFLHSDVQMSEGCLEALLLAQEEKKDAGAVGAKILYAESTEPKIQKLAYTVKSQGISVQDAKRNKTHFLKPIPNGKGEILSTGTLQPFVCMAVYADVLLVSKERFSEVDGFDTAYQSKNGKKDEFSEVDFCLKLYRAGYQNYLAPAALLLQSADVKEELDFQEKAEKLYNFYVYQGKWQSFLTKKWQQILEGKEEIWNHEEKEILLNPKKIDICAPMPDDENKKFWGDYHYALAMKKELEKLGYQVDVRPYQRWYEPTNSAVTIALRGNRPYYPKEETAQKNIMWNISHPADVSQEEYERFDLVYFASEKLYQKWKDVLKTKCDVLLQCTDPDVMKSVEEEKKYDLLFIGNSRRVYRQVVQDALTLDYPLTIYGRHWEEFPKAQNCVKDAYMPNECVGQAYRDAKIVLNDHWDDMKETGIVSNRLFDALAAEAFIISDEIPEIAEIFEGTVVTYKDREDLKEKADYYMKNPQEAKKLAAKGKELVLEKHTFANRMKKIAEDLKTLEGI